MQEILAKGRSGVVITLVAVVLLALAARAPQGDDEAALTVTFLGNEGFLLESGGRKVLIDALVGLELPDCVVQSETLRTQLERAEAPFDDVDLVLTTHVHADHFSVDAVGKHLAANPKARYVSTPQAVARLRAEFAGFEAIAPRVRAVGPADGKRERVEELGLDVLAMHHGRDREPLIENDAFVLELGDWKLLHMGDSQCSPEELAAFELGGEQVDVAFAPFWYLDGKYWKGSVESSVKPRQTVVMHLAPDWTRTQETANQRESRACVERIAAEYPQAIVFEEELEVRRFEAVGERDGDGD